MSRTVDLLGLVQGGRFRPSMPSRESGAFARLTRIAPQAAQPPESAEIDLSEYEGSALMVRGLDQGEWIYSAEIVERAGPILSAVVERLTGLPRRS